MGTPQSNLPPGFRFHPTDEELIHHYLVKKMASIPLPVSIIAEVDIYKLDPWELPAKAAFGEKEWYFFSPRDRKYPNGARPNRAAASGYWKATGTDKTIVTSLPGGGATENIGVKKALVFYKGRPPKGVKTNWIMHEYRLVDNNKPIKLNDTSMRLDDWVLCRIYKKTKHTLSSTEEATVVGDQDHAEEHIFKDTLLPISNKTPTPPLQNTLISQKSLSFSNLLDAMDYSMLRNFLSETENHSNSADFNSGNDYMNQQPSQINTNNSYMLQKNPQLLNPSGPNIENMRPNNNKRQFSSNVEEDMLLYPSKKYLSSSCNFPNDNVKYENPQWSYLMKQPLMNQQLLLGPHLRFQG